MGFWVRTWQNVPFPKVKSHIFKGVVAQFQPRIKHASGTTARTHGDFSAHRKGGMGQQRRRGVTSPDLPGLIILGSNFQKKNIKKEKQSRRTRHQTHKYQKNNTHNSHIKRYFTDKPHRIDMMLQSHTTKDITQNKRHQTHKNIHKYQNIEQNTMKLCCTDKRHRSQSRL